MGHDGRAVDGAAARDLLRELQGGGGGGAGRRILGGLGALDVAAEGGGQSLRPLTTTPAPGGGGLDAGVAGEMGHGGVLGGRSRDDLVQASTTRVGIEGAS